MCSSHHFKFYSTVRASIFLLLLFFKKFKNQITVFSNAFYVKLAIDINLFIYQPNR